MKVKFYCRRKVNLSNILLEVIEMMKFVDILLLQDRMMNKIKKNKKNIY